MRHQYAGDVGDYVKYALLRALCAAAGTGRLGVVWYLTDHTEKPGDGRFRPHLSGDGWDDLDPDLLMQLRTLDEQCGASGGITLRDIERSEILPPRTVFFTEPTPEANAPSGQRASARAAWSDRSYQAVDGCNLVFLDPDNGLQVSSVGPTSRLSGKYARAVEVLRFLAGGRGVVLYQHRDRSPWRAQKARIMEGLTGGSNGQVAARTVRFNSYGGRAFVCLSTDPRWVSTFDIALNTLAGRVTEWERAHRLIFE